MGRFGHFFGAHLARSNRAIKHAEGLHGTRSRLVLTHDVTHASKVSRAALDPFIDLPKSRRWPPLPSSLGNLRIVVGIPECLPLSVFRFRLLYRQHRPPKHQEAERFFEVWNEQFEGHCCAVIRLWPAVGSRYGMSEAE